MSCVQARLRSEHAPGQAACEKPQRPRPAAARSGPDGRRPAPVRPARRALPAAPGPRGEWREGAAAARGPARPVRSLGGPESPPAIGARLGGRGGRWVRSPGSPEPAEGRCAGRAGGVPRPGLPCGRAGGAPGLGAWGGRVGAGPRWGPGGGVGGRRRPSPGRGAVRGSWVVVLFHRLRGRRPEPGPGSSGPGILPPRATAAWRCSWGQFPEDSGDRSEILGTPPARLRAGAADATRAAPAGGPGARGPRVVLYGGSGATKRRAMGGQLCPLLQSASCEI